MTTSLKQVVFNIREEYRNKLLEAERLRLEAQAAEEAASRVEPEKKVPAPDGHKKKKEKKKWPGHAQHHLSSGEENPIFHYLEVCLLIKIRGSVNWKIDIFPP